jgi:hypothetical protein
MLPQRGAKCAKDNPAFGSKNGLPAGTLKNRGVRETHRKKTYGMEETGSITSPEFCPRNTQNTRKVPAEQKFSGFCVFRG